MELVIKGTPWEEYAVDGVTVHVKREDLCCPEPGPSFSKIRGVEAHLKGQEPGTPIGVLDTVHSKAGWGVSYICQALELPCYDFFPVYKREWVDETGADYYLREFQEHVEDLGAELMPLDAGRSSILYHQAKKALAEVTGGCGLMMPNALKLSETIQATAEEVLDHTPEELLTGTWVVSISSGTIGAGVLRGLSWAGASAQVVAHMGYSRSIDAARNYMVNSAGVIPHGLRLIDDGYAYKDKVSNTQIPFPCNEYYDAKAWHWMVPLAGRLIQPVVFWNIGS
jgi:hypothetical protein